MKAAAKKTLSVISGVLIALFLLLAALSLAITIFYSAKGEDAVLFGCQFRIVLTGSMEPEIGAGDLVAVRVAERDGAEFYEELEVGDVVTFYWRGASDKDEYIVTHRITEIKKTSTGFEYTLKGDAVESDTQTVTSCKRGYYRKSYLAQRRARRFRAIYSLESRHSLLYDTARVAGGRA